MTTTIDDARNEAVRVFVSNRIKEKFEGNRSAYAKAAGVSASIVTELLKGGRGAGLRVVDRIAAEAGVSPEVVLGRAEPPATTADVNGTAWGGLEGWAEAERIVREQDPQWPAYTYDRARQIRGIRPPLPVTPAVVRQALTLVFATTPPEELARLEADRQDKALEKMKKSAETKARGDRKR